MLVEHRKRLEWYHKWELWSDTASDLATEYIEKTGEQPITKHDGKDWMRIGVFATDRSLDEIRQAAGADTCQQ